MPSFHRYKMPSNYICTTCWDSKNSSFLEFVPSTLSGNHKNKIIKQVTLDRTATLCWKRKAPIMPKLTTDRAVSSLPYPIIDHFRTVLDYHKKGIQKRWQAIRLKHINKFEWKYHYAQTLHSSESLQRICLFWKILASFSWKVVIVRPGDDRAMNLYFCSHRRKLVFSGKNKS